jgi:glycosyltransferase involved in cell wall biosynthesis
VERPENFLVWLGRLVPEKGAHLAIKAAKDAGLPLVLAGTIDRHVPESVDYYENIIEPQIDGQRVKYIGPVNMEEKIDLLSRARAFLNPITWEEPFGMVMIEAMAVGCPVIAFARGAAPEIIAHGKCGYLVHDVREMTQFIKKIDELDRREVRSYVVQKFSVSVMAEKYTHLYRKVRASALLKSSLPKVSVSEAPLAASRSKIMPASTVLSTTAEPIASAYPPSLSAKTTMETEPEMLQ